MKQEKSIAAVVVLYNTRIEDSNTCNALKNIKNYNINVLIYDNSTKDFGNKASCEEKKWIYLGGCGNVGISRAYNACIEYLQKNSKPNYICLFDDDTNLDEEYFECILSSAADKKSGKILVPFIYASGKLISPCILSKGHIAHRFSSEQEALNYSGDRLSAINSCMAIDMSLFDNYRYDENIFLDGVDHSFLVDMKSQGEKITIINYKCKHSFSGVERPPKEAAMARFRIYAKDYAYIFRKNKIAYLMLVGKRAIRLGLQYKTWDFFFIKER